MINLCLTDQIIKKTKQKLKTIVSIYLFVFAVVADNSRTDYGKLSDSKHL